MTNLTAEEAATIGVDPDRSWVRVTCTQGHENVVEDHQGGSVAHCNDCGEHVPYGAPAVDVVAADSAASTDQN